ncbi:OsmC-like protein [Gleimia coleocanis DSM 15436]|uniref:OsmC-like protein n=1 Tax=Gleimia coleocanis DSM 15436 TaxID=525245 RepID=C0VZ70_9ACTO|nr:OsmC family protein [Gleimia coleocanis]EEH64723.1 OsmC-like protein [Gleimia coleocanis DSM 15436]
MAKSLWLERVGTGSFVGHSSEGPSVKIGHAPDEFTPGDLLKLALAGCNATSSDARFAAVLGDDYKSTIGVSGDWDAETDRFTHMDIEIVTDLTNLSDEELATLERRVRAAIERRCTISHTLNQGMTDSLVITSEG